MIAAVAVAAVSVAATTRTRTETAAPPLTAAPPRVRSAPQARAAPPVQRFRPGAERSFADALHGDDGMWLREPAHANARRNDSAATQSMAASVDGYVRATMRTSPQLPPQDATRAVGDAVDAYCPQYDDR